MFVRDTMSDVLKLAVYVVAGAALVYAKPYLTERGLFKGEFYVLALLAVLGMMLLISAGNLVMIYMGLELLRSEEHTSELQSLMRISYAVFCLKKKKRDKLLGELTSRYTDRENTEYTN